MSFWLNFSRKTPKTHAITLSLSDTCYLRLDKKIRPYKRSLSLCLNQKLFRTLSFLTSWKPYLRSKPSKSTLKRKLKKSGKPIRMLIPIKRMCLSCNKRLTPWSLTLSALEEDKCSLINSNISKENSRLVLTQNLQLSTRVW